MSKTIHAILVLCALGPASHAWAGTPADIQSRYVNEVRATDPAFNGFSAARGETLHRTKFGAGKPDTPACTSCHGEDARTAGRTRAGKSIEPMAASVSPTRYTDPAKVEKWFKRNCNEVLGRECTAREKGDWLAYMMKQ